MPQVALTYYSDMLCVWAYLAQPRIDEVKRNFGDAVQIEHRYCSVFGDTARKIATAWGAKGGYEGFNAHLMHSAEAFPEIRLNPELWRSVRPASSMGVHLGLKAAQMLETAGRCPPGCAEAAAWSLRRAFFEEGRNISDAAVQQEVLDAAGLPRDEIAAALADGSAFAALASDLQDAEALKIQGSPTFVLNDGRQKLYGNVGYRIIEANILELLRAPDPDQASWC